MSTVIYSPKKYPKTTNGKTAINDIPLLVVDKMTTTYPANEQTLHPLS